MTAALVLRPAVPADAGAIAAVHSASWRDTYAGFVPGGLPDTLEAGHRALWDRALVPDGRLRLVLVATRAGEIEGFAATHPDPDDPGTDHLAALHVRPDRRSAGIGACLMRELADRLFALGRRRLWCFVLAGNDAARRFYARLGAVEGERAAVPLIEGVVVEDLRLDFPPLDRLGARARAVLAARRERPLALASTEAPRVEGAPHPAGEAGRAAGRVKHRLGEPFGLSQFGVNRLELAPGTHSAPAHAHSHEDEFVLVLDGRVVLVSDGEERTLGPGDCAGFPAGTGRAHHLENRSDAPAVVLEIGARLPDRDGVDYPGRDLRVDRVGGRRVFLRSDGTVLGGAD